MSRNLAGLLLGLILALGSFTASCSGTMSRSEIEALPTPTILSASFTPVAGQIDEEAIKQAQSSPETAESEPEVDLELGQRIYGNLCAQCHGADLQGTAEGQALTSFEMSPDEFTVLLRTGGELGNQHQFGTTKVSETGIAALFAYLNAMADS